MTTLYGSGTVSSLLDKQFWRMHLCFFTFGESHEDHIETAKPYIFRLRLMYELSGYNQQYLDAQISAMPVKYIIFLHNGIV